MATNMEIGSEVENGAKTDAVKQDTLDRLNGLIASIALKEAAGLAYNGDYLAAETLLHTSFGRNPSPECLDLLARIAIQQGKIAEAESLWKQALSIDPECTNAQRGLLELGNLVAPYEPWNKWIPRFLFTMLFVVFIGILIFQAQKLGQLSEQLLGQFAQTKSTRTITDPVVTSPSLVMADLTKLQATVMNGQAQLGQQIDMNKKSINMLATTQARLLLDATPIPVDPFAGIQIQIDGIQFSPMGDRLKIQFDEGTFTYETVLSKTGREVLRNLGFSLVPYMDRFQIQVMGFEDDREIDAPNLPLDRAITVVKYLHQIGQVPEASLSVVSSTNKSAPYPNDSWKNRARNRTVILIFVPIN